MRLTYWVLLILLVLLLAAGVYLLTRKPSAPRDDQDVSEYGPGGRHVAAGDAGVQQVSPPTGSAESSSTQDAPHDQDARRDEQSEVISQEEHADASVPESAYTDTATGEEVPVEDEAPAHEDEDEDEAQGHVRDSRADSADLSEERRGEEHDDAAAVTYGSAPQVGEDTVYAAPAHRAHDADNDAAGQDTPPAAFAAGSDDAPSRAATSDSDAGHPGPSSQRGDDADYTLGEVGADSPGPESHVSRGSTAYPTAERTVQGFPGPESQPSEETRQAPSRDGSVLHHQGRDEDDGPQESRSEAPAWEEHDDDVPPDAAAAGFEPAPSPYGPGTALPDEDGSGPQGWAIKGNAGSMLFHTPDSPSYAESRAEVWFESEQTARAAGFAHWDRKRR